MARESHRNLCCQLLLMMIFFLNLVIFKEKNEIFFAYIMCIGNSFGNMIENSFQVESGKMKSMGKHKTFFDDGKDFKEELLWFWRQGIKTGTRSSQLTVAWIQNFFESIRTWNMENYHQKSFLQKKMVREKNYNIASTNIYFLTIIIIKDY